MSNTDARRRALEVRDDFELEPTSLFSYQSAGKVIVLGDEKAQINHPHRMSQPRMTGFNRYLCFRNVTEPSYP